MGEQPQWLGGAQPCPPLVTPLDQLVVRLYLASPSVFLYHHYYVHYSFSTTVFVCQIFANTLQIVAYSFYSYSYLFRYVAKVRAIILSKSNNILYAFIKVRWGLDWKIFHLNEEKKGKLNLSLHETLFNMRIKQMVPLVKTIECMNCSTLLNCVFI